MLALLIGDNRWKAPVCRQFSIWLVWDPNWLKSNHILLQYYNGVSSAAADDDSQNYRKPIEQIVRSSEFVGSVSKFKATLIQCNSHTNINHWCILHHPGGSSSRWICNGNYRTAIVVTNEEVNDNSILMINNYFYFFYEQNLIRRPKGFRCLFTVSQRIPLENFVCVLYAFGNYVRSSVSFDHR